ncbi:major facilitator superfamily-like protein [Aureococcus anophagefferens]|nr:major facilitator superfamily-like protein [Aureococcus anophagefferens]
MEEVRAPLAPDAERSVRTAVIGNFVDIFGLCTILPLIPFFVKDVGAPKIWVGLISGAQFLGCCLGNFTWGQVGDRRDPNAVALGLMVGDAVFFALTALRTDAPSLCAVRVLTGFCAFWVLGETLISVVPGRASPSDRAAKLATVFGHAHYRAAVFVYCAVGLTFNGVNTVLYVTLAYRYGLREWQVGLFGLGLCFALMLSLSFYETWSGRSASTACSPSSARRRRALRFARGAREGAAGAFSCLFFASVVVFGPLFNTATMVITNVARTWAPGAEGTALSYASLLHNAAQARAAWKSTGRGSRALRLVPDGARLARSVARAAAATLAFAAAPLAVRVAVPLPPDTFMPARAFEVRLFGAAPPLGGDPGAGRPSTARATLATLRPRRRRAGRRGALAVAEPGDAAPLAVAEPADGATTV